MGTARRVAACACAALLVAGCSSSSADPEPEPSTSSPTPTEAETTETPSPTPTVTESDDPFAMPDPVTEEYVDRVINTLYEEWGAITREILEQPADPTGVTSAETKERIQAIFGDRVP